MQILGTTIVNNLSKLKIKKLKDNDQIVYLEKKIDLNEKKCICIHNYIASNLMDNIVVELKGLTTLPFLSEITCEESNTIIMEIEGENFYFEGDSLNYTIDDSGVSDDEIAAEFAYETIFNNNQIKKFNTKILENTQSKYYRTNIYNYPINENISIVLFSNHYFDIMENKKINNWIRNCGCFIVCRNKKVLFLNFKNNSYKKLVEFLYSKLSNEEKCEIKKILTLILCDNETFSGLILNKPLKDELINLYTYLDNDNKWNSNINLKNVLEPLYTDLECSVYVNFLNKMHATFIIYKNDFFPCDFFYKKNECQEVLDYKNIASAMCNYYYNKKNININPFNGNVIVDGKEILDENTSEYIYYKDLETIVLQNGSPDKFMKIRGIYSPILNNIVRKNLVDEKIKLIKQLNKY